MTSELRAALEAILLVVDEPVAEMQLAQIMEQPTERVAAMLEDIAARYTAAGHGFDLRRAAGGWRLYTRPEYAAYVERFVLDGQSVRLTQAALETLAVVAYKQPVTRSRISAIRGVNCDGVMRTLATRGLIEECGTEPETGALPVPDDRRCSWRSSASTRSTSCRRWPRSCPTTWKKCSMPQADPATAERLQKVLAAAGVGSRRACEDLIFRRRVTVDGRVAQLGDKVDPATAEIHVDGQRVITDTKLVYLAMNKPRGVVSTMDDEKGRTALADFLGTFEQRVFHVGRLDADSEGLLLLTNDGTLAHKLMHPVVRGGEDVPGRGGRAAAALGRPRGCRPAWSSRTARRGSTRSGCVDTLGRPRRWRSPCTRGASTSCGG